jgi:hypothetical protein
MENEPASGRDSECVPVKTAGSAASVLGLTRLQHGFIFLASFALLVTHRLDAILNAQFYAEDGRVFFQDAYNHGWASALIHPYGGYFHAVPRLSAALALLVPLSFAPLLLNLIALGFEVLPVNLLLSARSAAWGRLGPRVLMAALYLGLPNCAEMFANITNVQCSLALIAFLLLIATPPRSAGCKLADGLFLALFGLSGPYCIFLLPIAAFLAWKRDGAWRWAPLAVLSATALIEVLGLLVFDSQGRHHYMLGANWQGFTRILSGQIYLGALLGQNSLSISSGTATFIALACVAIGASAVMAACFMRASIEMRCLIVFAAIVFTASLVSPMIITAPGQTLWEALAQAREEHYWFFPILAFAWSLVQCTQLGGSRLKFAGVYLLCLMCVGIVHDWRHPAFVDFHFAAQAKQFETLPPGTAAILDENPDGWHVYLTKR